MKFTKSIIICVVFLLAYSACKKDNSLLPLTQQKRYWFEPVPFGMVFIEQGTFIMGANDEDVNNSTEMQRKISIGGFWMDETEITNNEYREFTTWVRDSIMRTMLGEQIPEFLIEDERTGQTMINWEQYINFKDDDVKMALEELYLPLKESFFGRRQVDTHKLFYKYQTIDLRSAARRPNSYNYDTQSYDGSLIKDGRLAQIENRSSFLINENIAVYPDTLCWIRDYTYSYNEPLAVSYYWHPAYNDYPVVGVSWHQAKAFAHWRTQKKNKFQSSINEVAVADYRLPTEAEWEYAARGGYQNSVYPWGAFYGRDCDGCLLANFKPMRGNYVADYKSGSTTSEVATYDPNDFGLYDMAGNVAEWTLDAFDEAGYNLVNDFNPTFQYNAQPDDNPVLKRKVIRGGSWKDIAHYTKVATRDYEYQDTTKSYIGFRCVRPSFGNKMEY